MIEGRSEIGGGGRSVGHFLGQGGCPAAAAFHRLLHLGDSGRDPLPERGSRVLGLEVRDLWLDASLQIRDLRSDLLEARADGSGRLLAPAVGETTAQDV